MARPIIEAAILVEGPPRVRIAIAPALKSVVVDVLKEDGTPLGNGLLMSGPTACAVAAACGALGRKVSGGGT